MRFMPYDHYIIRDFLLYFLLLWISLPLHGKRSENELTFPPWTCLMRGQSEQWQQWRFKDETCIKANMTHFLFQALIPPWNPRICGMTIKPSQSACYQFNKALRASFNAQWKYLRLHLRHNADFLSFLARFEGYKPEIKQQGTWRL